MGCISGSGGTGGRPSIGFMSGDCSSKVSMVIVVDGLGLDGRDLSSAWRSGDDGSSVTSLKPSKYIEMASSTLIPPSFSGPSGVSGERSVMELLFVKTLLRSVPLFCSMLEREVIAELTLDRRASFPP